VPLLEGSLPSTPTSPARIKSILNITPHVRGGTVPPLQPNSTNREQNLSNGSLGVEKSGREKHSRPLFDLPSNRRRFGSWSGVSLGENLLRGGVVSGFLKQGESPASAVEDVVGEISGSKAWHERVLSNAW
jgi:hypothetical protein